MSKCLVFVLCAVSLTTLVVCAPGSENFREKQSTRQDVTDQVNGASRTKRQSLGSLEVVYLDAVSLDPTKHRDLHSKEISHPSPVNDVTNPGQNLQQIPDSNLELVSQNTNFAVYKLKSGGSLNDLLDEKTAQASETQYDSEQYSGNSGRRDPPPPPPPSDDREPPPPPEHYPPPPPDHYPAPPNDHRPPLPHHHHPPTPLPPDDYRLDYYGRYRYNDRPPPPYRRDYDDRHTRQSPYNRPAPPHRGGPPPHHRGPPPDYGRPPPHHGGPPDHYDGRPPHHGGPPARFPPHYHGGPPDRRPPPPRDRPNRFDNRPPYNRPPPPPPHDRRPPPDQDPYDQGNNNNGHSQNDNNSGKVIDGTQTSSTTEAETDDDQYQLDVRFANDDQNEAETMKRDIPSRKTPARQLSHLSPFIFQAAVVKPED